LNVGSQILSTPSASTWRRPCSTYDLEADPYEMTNIIGRPESRDVLQQMKAELQRLLDDTR